jgi:small-conductance mechanosensitive channel
MFGKRKQLRIDRMERMFETRSEAWSAAGLEIEVNERVVSKARRELAVLIPLLLAVVIGQYVFVHHTVKVGQYLGDQPVVVGQHVVHHRMLMGGRTVKQFAGLDSSVVTVVAVIAVLVLGWLISRDLSRISPSFFRRMDPGTAGTVEFLVRFATVAATVLGALGVAGIAPQTLAVGGAFTAIVLGLAAQQTLGNFFAGLVLLSARPFRLGERVRFYAGALGGSQEGTVSSLGLLYTTLASGADRIMIPNNAVLAAAVVPLREPEAVDVRVRLASGIRPSQVQKILDENIQTPTRASANVVLEEIDGEELVVKVKATPERASDGAELADEIIAALAAVTGQHAIRPVADVSRGVSPSPR